MKVGSKLRLFTAPIACFLLVHVSCAQSGKDTRPGTPPKPTIDQVLTSYEGALGGREAWQKLTTRVTTGTMAVSGTTGQNISVEIYQQAPNKFLNITTFPSGARTEIGFDGDVGWSKDSVHGTRRLTGLELDMTKHMAEFNEVFDLRHAFPQMTLLGAKQLNGRLTYVIRAYTPEGHIGTMYFDAENGLRVRVTSLSASGQTYDDYIEQYCDLAYLGIKYPCRYREVYPGYTLSVRVTDIRHNIPIDASRFVPPSFGYKIER